MSSDFYVPVDMHGLEIQNHRLHQISGDLGSPNDGDIWFNNTTDEPKVRATRGSTSQNRAMISDDDDFHNRLNIVTSIQDVDELLIWDDSVSEVDHQQKYRRITKANLFAGISTILNAYNEIIVDSGTSPLQASGESEFRVSADGSILQTVGSSPGGIDQVDIDWLLQNVNTVLAGPSSGGDAVPTFRALVDDDMPTSYSAADWDTAYTHSQIVSGNPHGTVITDLGYGVVTTLGDPGLDSNLVTEKAIRTAIAGLTNTFVGLTDTPSDYTGGVGGYIVMVNSTPDGLEFVDPSGYALSNFDDDLSYENPLTFQNGLTRATNTITWGGTLNAVTVITGTSTYTWTLSNTNPSPSGSAKLFANSGGGVTIQGWDNTDFTGDYSRIFVDQTGAYMESNVSSDLKQFVVVQDFIRISDAQDSKGAIYAADYGTNGRSDDRWIPDWGNVKTYIGGQSTNSLIQSPGAGQDTYAITWDNGNTEYTLTAFAGGATSFIGLTDTPANYTGSADYLLFVNSTPDAVVFTDPSGYAVNNFSGTLTASWTITGTNTLIPRIRASSTGVGSVNMEIQTGITFSVAAYANDDYTGNYGEIYITDDNAFLRLDIGANEKKIDISTTAMTITDSDDSTGFIYAADYSTAGMANDRWLPDWAAVRDHIGGQNVTTASGGITNPTASEDGYVIFWDNSNNRYDLKAESGSGNHNILSSVHSDAATTTVLRGMIITGQTATPQWDGLAISTDVSNVLRTDGTDISWGDLNFADLGTTPTTFAGYGISDSLANLNTAVTDATLIDTTDSRLSDDRDPNAHILSGARHTASGLTVGYVIAADGATTFSWRQLLGSEISNDLGWGGGVSVTSQGNDQILTCTGTTDVMTAEDNLTFNGTSNVLTITGTINLTGSVTDIAIFDSTVEDSFSRVRIDAGLNSDTMLSWMENGTTQASMGWNASDNQLYIIKGYAGGIDANEKLAAFDPDGAVRLFYNNAEKLATTDTGISITGSAIHTGGTNANVEVLNDGYIDIVKNSNSASWARGIRWYSYQDAATLGIYAYGATRGALDYIAIGESHTDELAKFIRNGAVELYYNNSRKLYTTTNGIEVTGSIITETTGDALGGQFITGTTDTNDYYGVSNLVLKTTGASLAGHGPALYFSYTDSSYTNQTLAAIAVTKNDSGQYGGEFEVWVRNTTNNPVSGIFINENGRVYLKNLASSSETVTLRWTASGTPAGHVSYPTSDVRFKSNVIDWYVDALHVLQQFRPKQFEWASEPGNKRVGWIAQEGMLHIPEMFPYIKNTDRYSLAEFEILPYFHKAIIEVNEKVESHEERIARLEARIVELESQLT